MVDKGAIINSEVAGKLKLNSALSIRPTLVR